MVGRCTIINNIVTPITSSNCNTPITFSRDSNTMGAWQEAVVGVVTEDTAVAR